MKQILTDAIGDLGNVLRTIRAGYCRGTSALMLLFVVLAAFDMFAYENHVGLPLSGALGSAFAGVSLPQGARAAALTVLPALTLLIVVGLLRSRRLGAGKRPLLERLEAVRPAAVGALHVWTFWIAVTIWIGYMMLGPGLVRNAGLSFDRGVARNLYQPLVLPVMTSVSSFGSWLLVSLLTVVGATIVEFVRRVMAAKHAAQLANARLSPGDLDGHEPPSMPKPPISRFPPPAPVEKRHDPDQGDRGKRERPPKSG